MILLFKDGINKLLNAISHPNNVNKDINALIAYSVLTEEIEKSTEDDEIQDIDLGPEDDEKQRRYIDDLKEFTKTAMRQVSEVNIEASILFTG